MKEIVLEKKKPKGRSMRIGRNRAVQWKTKALKNLNAFHWAPKARKYLKMQVKALGLLINYLFRANKIRDTNESPFPSFPWNLLLVRSALP